MTTSDETSDEFSVEAVEAKGGLVAPVSGQFITPIVGVNAQFDVVGFRPGRDLESDDAYRARLTTVGAKPRGYGLENDWIAWCKEFSSAIVGVSVFGTSGQVFLYPVVNNRPDGIPSDEDVTALQNWLNTYRNVIGVVSVTVIKPEVVSVPVVIADLDPDTVAIRSNIEALLTKYFAENTKTGQIVSVSTLYAQIGLIDELKIGGTFKITSPANDVVLSQIQLADFGGVTYA